MVQSRECRLTSWGSVSCSFLPPVPIPPCPRQSSLPSLLAHPICARISWSLCQILAQEHKEEKLKRIQELWENYIYYCGCWSIMSITARNSHLESPTNCSWAGFNAVASTSWNLTLEMSLSRSGNSTHNQSLLFEKLFYLSCLSLFCQAKATKFYSFSLTTTVYNSLLQ